MLKRGDIENKDCPFCWKGVLYNTGVKQKKGPEFFYQCRMCGKTMTRSKYMRTIEHMNHPGRREPPRRIAGAKKEAPAPKHKPEPEPFPGFVVGVVRDMKTKKPIDMAHICLRGRSVEAFTNKFGQYALEPVPEHKSFRVEFTSPGHAKKVHIFKEGIKPGEVRKLDIELRPTKAIVKPASLQKPPLISIFRGSKDKSAKGGIEGVVRDIQGEPVFAALVTIFHHERILIVQTDTMGHYELMGVLPPGDYMVRAAAYGYSFDRKWVRIQKGKVVHSDFVLVDRSKDA
jgi:hypothetical protein